MFLRKFFALSVVLLLTLGVLVSIASASEDTSPPSITVHKFHDVNQDGDQDAGEEDIEGWLIQIWVWDNTGLYKITEGLTDSSGLVTFTGLPSGLFKVWEELRECWEPAKLEDVYGPWEGGYYKLVNVASDAFVEFGNVYTCTPPTGGQGCTPGYWKQEHHFDSWVGFAPIDSFFDIFRVGPDVSLLTVLETGGGEEKAMMRHATAALLNASSGDVDYLYTDVIAMVQAAFGSGDFEDAKDMFEAQNETLCPLD